MPSTEIKGLLDKQREFFATGKTLPVEFRVEQLKKLQAAISSHQDLLTEALKRDLNRSKMETFICEFIIVMDELKHIIKNLPKWVKADRPNSPFPICWPGRSEIIYEPYGSVLVIGPWNYPVQLTLTPLIGAICAGNCAIVKPSEIATHTQDVIYKLITETFAPEYVTAIKANPQEMTLLLQEKFDYIFFTGGTEIGKVIMQAAAKHLTPLTLELGGKSPCIVDESANLEYAARRIIWAKYLNAGQTCIAPDYLLVQQSCKSELIENLTKVCNKFFGDAAEKSHSYSRIINNKHFTRLKNLMANGKVIFGGTSAESELFIAPTLIDDVSLQDPIMQEEIFGPLLPIISFDKLSDAIKIVNSFPKPLALYLFSKNKSSQRLIKQTVAFGGGCINDAVVQIGNHNMPFGGVGNSGLGKYHGRYSFETFSHRKGVFSRLLPIDLNFTYPPYSEKKLSILRKLLRF